MSFSDQLRRLRTALGLTRRQLAELAGLSPRVLENYEQGRRGRPPAWVVARLATALGCHESELDGASGQPAKAYGRGRPRGTSNTPPPWLERRMGSLL